MTKSTIKPVRPAKTLIRLCRCTVWSESLLIMCACYSLQAIQRGINKNPWWMPRLILVLSGHTGLIVGFVLHWLVWFCGEIRKIWILLLSAARAQAKAFDMILFFFFFNQKVFISEPTHDKTYKMACVPSTDSDQPGNPASLIRALKGHHYYSKDPSFLHEDSEDQSDWADAQADLSLCSVHMPFCRFCYALALLSYFSMGALILESPLVGNSNHSSW